MHVEGAVFFFNDTATTEIYTLSLHDALPILGLADRRLGPEDANDTGLRHCRRGRSEEHTSELQSQFHLVCRLLLEKKNSTNLTFWHVEGAARETTSATAARSEPIAKSPCHAE